WSLGWAYFLAGQYGEAITTLKEVVSRMPTHLFAYRVLADSYVQQWAWQQSADAQTLTQALAAAQRSITLNDAFSVRHVVLGSVYLWQKQYEPAITEMERAIALDPNNADGYAGLAETQSQVDTPKEAIAMAEQALRRKPYVADQHLGSVGMAYYLAGRP